MPATGDSEGSGSRATAAAMPSSVASNSALDIPAEHPSMVTGTFANRWISSSSKPPASERAEHDPTALPTEVDGDERRGGHQIAV